jgi:uncharacterized protein (DUF58 family)
LSSAANVKVKEEKSVVKPKIPLPLVSYQIRQAAVFVLVAALFIWGLVSLVGFVNSKISLMRPKQAAEVQQPAEQPQQKQEDSKAVVSNEVVVSLTVKRRCFLRVKADGKLLFEGILKQGMVETWRADKELEFKISDGSAVYLEVNGKKIPQLTSMRKPIKSLKITPAGISVVK